MTPTLRVSLHRGTYIIQEEKSYLFGLIKKWEDVQSPIDPNVPVMFLDEHRAEGYIKITTRNEKIDAINKAIEELLNEEAEYFKDSKYLR